MDFFLGEIRKTMNTIPILVNSVEQGFCELTKTKKYVCERLLDNHTLTADEVQTLQSMWNIEYQSGEKVTVDKLEYNI